MILAISFVVLGTVLLVSLAAFIITLIKWGDDTDDNL